MLREIPFLNKAVNIKTVHNTFLCAPGGEGEGAKVGLHEQAHTWERFIVLDEGEGRVAFKTFHGTYLRANPENEEQKIDCSKSVGLYEKFTLEQKGDNKWAISTANGMYVSASKTGLDTTSKVGASELFTISLADVFFMDQVVAIRSAHGTFLRASSLEFGSKVDAQTFISTDEKFKVENLGNGYVAFKSVFGTYISAHPGLEGAKVDLQTSIGNHETFQLERIDSASWGIKSFHGTFLRVHKGGEGSKVDVQTFIGPWEIFTFIHADVAFVNSIVALKTAHNTLLQTHPGLGGLVTQTTIPPWEKFEVVGHKEGSVSFKTSHGTYLMVYPDGKVTCNLAIGEWEKFRFEKYDDKWAIRTFHGTYLRANNQDGDFKVVAKEHPPSSWEKFLIIADSPFLGQKVVIRSVAQNTFVRANPGGQGATVDMQTQAGPWEKFEVIAVGNGQVAFKSAHNTYLRANPGQGTKVDTQTVVGPCEKFTLTQIGENWIIKTAHGTYIGSEGTNVATYQAALQFKIYRA